MSPRREVRLSVGERIDFLVYDVGIEVKIDGSVAALMRQAARYLRCDEVRSLVVVTTLARHRALPADMFGKAVYVAHLEGNAF